MKRPVHCILALLLAIAPRAYAEEPNPREPAAPPAFYKASKGPYEITVIAHLELEDTVQDKALRVRLTFPKSKDSASAARHPVIVFSHGAYGSKDNYGPLAEHWASHGYIVLQATHADSVSLGSRLGENVFRHWESRTLDVSFLLDALAGLHEHVPALEGRIDRARIGVGGHSFGAHTAMLLGGVQTKGRGAGRYVSHRDKRVKAVLLLSPQGRGDLLDRTSYETLVVPAMVVSGTRDTGRKGQSPSWRREPYDLAPAGDKQLVWIEGAQHNFGGITGAPSRRFQQARGMRENPAHVEIVRSASILFWDAYLRGDEAARTYVASDALGRAARGALTLERK